MPTARRTFTALALASALALTGCTTPAPEPTRTPSPSTSPAATPTPTPTPAPTPTVTPTLDAAPLPTQETISCDTMLDPAVDAALRAQGYVPAPKRWVQFAFAPTLAAIECPWA